MTMPELASVETRYWSITLQRRAIAEAYVHIEGVIVA